MARKWTFHPHDETGIGRLSSQLRVSPLLAQVLLARGFHETEAARSFLSAKISDLHDPSGLPGVDAAADAIVKAMQDGRRITIYGDYDVDGVTGTSILWHCLRLNRANVDYYIPCRLEEGYGLNEEALRQLREEDPQRLIVTVDCGIASVAEADYCRSVGLDLIVTDHHHFAASLPAALVVVHPRLPGSEYPFGELCGAGVAFKLAWAICQRLGDGRRASPQMKEFLKQAVGLAALGTVADVVPLQEENRVIVRYGLQTLRQQSSVGMQALIKSAGLSEKSELRSEDIAFSLAPRINAAGRLGQARLAVELLTTDQPERAAQLAHYLEELNSNRKTVERRIFRQAKEMVAENPEWEAHKTLVLANHDWHPGVIGIVASRMTEEFGKPTLMIALREDGTGAGSGRSWAGFDLYSGLASCRDHVLTYGGHKAAAGFRLRASEVASVRQTLAEWAEENFHPTDTDTELRIDAEVLLSEVTVPAVRELEHLGPFGQANPQPRFVVNRVELAGPPKTMGEGNRHLSLVLRQNRTTMRAVAFGRGDWADELATVNGLISVSFAPVISTFNGFTRAEMHVIDWKPSFVQQAAG